MAKKLGEQQGSVREGFGMIGSGFGMVGSSIGHGVVNGVTAVGHGIANGASAVGHGIVNGVSAVGRGALALGYGVYKGTSYVVNGAFNGINSFVDNATDAIYNSFDRMADTFKRFGQKIRDKRASHYTRFEVNHDGETFYQSPSVRIGSRKYYEYMAQSEAIGKVVDKICSMSDISEQNSAFEQLREEKAAQQSINFNGNMNDYADMLISLYLAGDNDNEECKDIRRAFVTQYCADAIDPELTADAFPECGEKAEFEKWLDSSDPTTAFNPKVVYAMAMNENAKDIMAEKLMIHESSFDAQSVVGNAVAGDRILLGYTGADEDRKPVYLALFDENGNGMSGNACKGQIRIGDYDRADAARIDMSADVFDFSGDALGPDLGKMAFTVDRLSDCVLDMDYLDSSANKLPSQIAKLKDDCIKAMTPYAIDASYELLKDEVHQRIKGYTFEQAINEDLAYSDKADAIARNRASEGAVSKRDLCLEKYKGDVMVAEGLVGEADGKYEAFEM